MLARLVRILDPDTIERLMETDAREDLLELLIQKERAVIDES